jgi:hypothetical protein
VKVKKKSKPTWGYQLLDGLTDFVDGLNDFRLKDIFGCEDHGCKATFIWKVFPKPIRIYSEIKNCHKKHYISNKFHTKGSFKKYVLKEEFSNLTQNVTVGKRAGVFKHVTVLRT